MRTRHDHKQQEITNGRKGRVLPYSLLTDSKIRFQMNASFLTRFEADLPNLVTQDFRKSFTNLSTTTVLEASDEIELNLHVTSIEFNKKTKPIIQRCHIYTKREERDSVK